MISPSILSLSQESTESAIGTFVTGFLACVACVCLTVCVFQKKGNVATRPDEPSLKLAPTPLPPKASRVAEARDVSATSSVLGGCTSLNSSRPDARADLVLAAAAAQIEKEAERQAQHFNIDTPSKHGLTGAARSGASTPGNSAFF